MNRRLPLFTAFLNIRSMLIFIYDFGGGTFDTFLIVRYGKFVTVADTQGDSFLGGRDIDKAISKFIMDKNALNTPLSADMLASIKEETNSTGRSSYNIISDDGSIINIQFTFDDLVKCVEPFTRRSFSILRSLVSRNKLRMERCFLSVVLHCLDRFRIEQMFCA